MSLNAAWTELSNSLKTLFLAWEDAREGWNDAVARDFESHHWEPLDATVRGTLQAMDRLTPILQRARQECS